MLVLLALTFTTERILSFNRVKVQLAFFFAYADAHLQSRTLRFMKLYEFTIQVVCHHLAWSTIGKKPVWLCSRLEKEGLSGSIGGFGQPFDMFLTIKDLLWVKTAF